MLTYIEKLLNKVNEKGQFEKGHKSWNEGKGMSKEQKKINRKKSLEQYNNSEKGKETKKRNTKGWYKNNPDYNKNYFKENIDAIKIITKKYREKNKKEIAEKNKIYRQNNKESLSIRTKKYREKNIASIKEYDKMRYYRDKEKNKPRRKAYYEKVKNTNEYKQKYDEYILKSKDHIRARSKIYRETNKDRIQQKKCDYYNEVKVTETFIQKQIKYRKNNRPTLTILGARYRAKKSNAQGKHSLKEWQELKILLGKHCLGCWKNNVQLAQDHIMPISKGGSDWINNIQPLCKSCNSSKHSKFDVINLINLAEISFA